MSADEFKQQGNTAFVAKDFDKAIEFFSKAIDASEAPNHVLYSNRSACYSSSKKFAEALKDAEECVKISPSWSKGYNRVGAAQFGLSKLEEAEKSYERALELDSSNKAAREGLEHVQSVKAGPQMPDLGFSQMFNDPNLIQKLRNNPKTADMMRDPQLVSKLEYYKTNPQAIGQDLFTDRRLMTIMAALLGIDLNMGDPNSAGETQQQPQQETSKAKEPESKQAPKQEQKPEAEPMEVDEESSSKAAAEAEKAEGNKLYKARQFEDAISRYNKAWELHKDITYLNNRSAAEFEKGDYDTAIETLTTAVDAGRESRTDYKVIAKSFARIGNCYYKLKDLRKAIEFYHKSLTEHRTGDVLNKLRATEKELKKAEAEAYINPEKAEEARLQGKEFFTKGDWPNSVKAYTEMVKRAPEDARGYSNRAAALAKLMSFPEAIEDCDKAVSIDPNFVRAYIRKASAQIAVKEYALAIETLGIAREKDAQVNNSANVREIDQLSAKASSQRFQPASDDESPEQTYERAMRDPEVASIMKDPVMQSILSQAQQDPAALQEHIKNPEVFRKIQVLIQAGIIRTR